MIISFCKYQGTGNDFIMIDNRVLGISLTRSVIVRLCDRKFGIGSDGIILIERDNSCDFYMNFYNPDGSVSFCGNGSRCAVRFAQQLGMIGDQGEFRAIDGRHAFLSDEEKVQIRMRDVAQVEHLDGDMVINTGSPHYIVYKEDIDQLDILQEARKIRYSERFSTEGINVNFLRQKINGIDMRTYERGVEDETLSCGTGVTAAALSFALKNDRINEVPVHTRGGDLNVRFKRVAEGFSEIWLSGPAVFVFNGEIQISI